MPGASHAPNDWPAEPRSVKRIVPGGRPAAPCSFVTAFESRPPTVRFRFAIANSASTGAPSSIAARAASISCESSASSSAGGCASVRRRGPSALGS